MGTRINIEGTVSFGSTNTITLSHIEPITQYARVQWEEGEGLKSDFGGGNIIRSKEKFIRNHTQGKIGEVALSVLFREAFNIDSTVNMEPFEGNLQTDNGDLESIEGRQPRCSFDIKTTKKYNKWIAIRESIWKGHEPLDPILIALVEPEDCNPGSKDVDVHIPGWVLNRDLDTRVVRGQRLPRPNGTGTIGPPMKTNNRCYPICKVRVRSRSEWEDFLKLRLLG